MNAATDIETANKLATALEKAEARRLSLPVTKVRGRLADRLGISPGTLENIRRARSKIIPNWLMTRIRWEFVAVLQNEIVRLEYEIDIARQAGMDYRDDDLAAAEAQLVAARKVVGGLASLRNSGGPNGRSRFPRE